MSFFYILPYYFSWHYTTALVDLQRVWRNFLSFTYHFFSIPVLFRTLFAPWQRVQDGYGPGHKIMETFVFNTIMRGIGFVVRTCVIIFGHIMMAIVLFSGILFYVAWFLLPVILAVFFFWGLNMLFS